VSASVNADAWIDQASPTSNKGTDSILKVQSKSGNNFRALLRFTLPPMPNGCVVQSAVLRLYSPSRIPGRTLEAWQLSTDWSESLVNWNNQPLPIGVAAVTITDGEDVEWQVAPQVQAMYSMAANYGFLIRDLSEDGSGFEQQFHSREKGESMPELVISFGLPVPTSTPTLVPPTATVAPATLTPTATPILPTATGAPPMPTATATSAASSCTPTTVTLSASADAWIDQGGPSSNKGTDSILKVMSKSNSSMRALVLFNLPAAPQGCVIQSATLRLYAASYKSNRTLQALRVNANWTENGVTWSNQPVTIGAAATTNSGSGWRQWNVAAMVQAIYNSGLNYGFLIRDANENQDAEQQFHSREKGQNIPQLVITFGPPP
jgi:hypothetical protein